MNRRRWKAWVAGIALVQLLVIGVDVALLWPSEAEGDAARLGEGATWEQVLDGSKNGRLIWAAPPLDVPGKGTGQKYEFSYPNGSILSVIFGSTDSNVIALRANSPPPVNPLTRLRRTLARIIPALGE